MNNHINQILGDLGFEEREIKIYLSLIEHSHLTALQISKKAFVDRTTVYDLLERLINKGIVSFITQNKVKHFRAIPPEKLADYFHDKYSSFEKILPELNDLSKKSKEAVGCEMFQGVNGIKEVLKELLGVNLNYKVIGIRKEYEELLGFFHEQGVFKADKLKVRETAIVERGTEFKKLKNGSYKYLDKNSLPPVSTLIYGDVVVFFIWTQPYYAIRIENKVFRKTQEDYFNLLWKIAKN